MATGNAINANSTGLVRYNGTGTFDSITTTQHDILVGAASNGITSVAPSATSGVPVISQGAAADPTFGTVVVAGGGTGVATFANTSALICTGTSSTGAVQNIASAATGQVLISAGTSTLPTWSASPTVTSITLSGGTALSTYIEGTFTPGISFGGGTTGITYTSQQGFYTRIGNRILYNFFIQLSNKGSSTGTTKITGLPVAVGGSGTNFITLGMGGVTLTALYTYLMAEIDSSATTATIIQVGSAQAFGTAIADTAFTNTSILYGTGSYGTV